MKKYFIICLIILINLFSNSCSDNSYVVKENTSLETEDTSMLIIDLKGAIRLPNVYTVKTGTILYDLINLAGGFDVDADVNSVNLALVLKENQMIQIPYKKTSSDESSSNLININTASLSELCTLPGIGTAKANNIISYRNNNGYFVTIEDIKKVNGISEGLFSKIKEYICV